MGFVFVTRVNVVISEVGIGMSKIEDVMRDLLRERVNFGSS